MSKLAATLVFAAVGIISPAFALYGSYALSAAPTAKSAFRLFRAGAATDRKKSARNAGIEGNRTRSCS